MKAKRNLITITWFLAICLALGTTAMAASLNVPGDYSTIGAAVAAAADGDIIRVGPGSYTENVLVDMSVTIRGKEGADNTTVYVIVKIPSQSYLGKLGRITRIW